MHVITENYINQLVWKLKQGIKTSIKKRLHKRAVAYMKALSYLSYWFNLAFKDELIEDSIKKLSLLIRKRELKNHSIDNTIVLIDTICSDSIGLSHQYLKGLVSAEYKIYYIYEHGLYSNGDFAIQTLLRSYTDATVVEIPSNVTGQKRSQWLYDILMEIGSTKIICHFHEWTIEECIALCALPQEFQRYKINLADHTFWPGVCCTDYVFEFRHYGANLSVSQRGFKQEQELYVPFYPAITNSKFEGLPDKINGNFVFVTGGAVYKVVDDNLTFFKLCRDLLSACPNSVILFAGANDSNKIILEARSKYALGERFITIDYRKDINEVFKHCNVFINTYPVGGGLMCQIAAQNSIPILNLYDNRAEEFVNQKSRYSFTSYTEEKFVEEAYHLYYDKAYRKKCGEEIKQCVVSDKEFEQNLDFCLKAGNSLFCIDWDDDFIPRNFSLKDKIIYRNKSRIFFYYDLFNIMGHYMSLIMLRNYIELYPHVLKRDFLKIIHKYI